MAINGKRKRIIDDDSDSDGHSDTENASSSTPPVKSPTTASTSTAKKPKSTNNDNNNNNGDATVKKEEENVGENGDASTTVNHTASSSSSSAAVKKEEEEADNDVDMDNTAVPKTPIRSRKDMKRTKRTTTTATAATTTKVETPSKKVLKEDDDDSESDDDDDEDDETPQKKKKTSSSSSSTAAASASTKKKKKMQIKDDDYDDSDSDSGDDDDDDDNDNDDDNDSEYEEEETPKKKKKKTTAAASKKKASSTKNKKKAAVKKEESDDDDEEEEEEKPKSKKSTASKKTKTTKKEEEDDEDDGVKDEKSTNSKGKGRKVKKEEEVEIFKWWLEDNVEELLNSDVKWRTLKHNGVVFPPPYEPHGIPVTYDGKDVKLTPEQEELATMYALMRETEYYNKPLFQKNFWSVWQEKLGKKHTIKDLKKCNFTKIWEWHLQEKEKKLGRSKEEKKQEKEEREKLDEPYRWCYIDGRKEKVGNFKIEPPGLFRGRGEHPKQGLLKKRVTPEDVTINIGKVKDAPKPPKGHKWKEIVTNNKATWLASWKEPLTGTVKYVNLASSSTFKGISDFLKYQTARDLKKQISKIRKAYKKNWTSEDTKTQQLGVAMYFIDKLALRVGNEKDDEEEADTVGCCSLRCEHINLKEDNKVEFDFLGKDSIRYLNTVDVDPAVYKCLKRFKKGKAPDANLFEDINSSVLNKELKQFMPKLTAKVFRTFNASLTLDKCLREMDDEIADMDVTEKLAAYNKANREVAILCNHQRTVSKTHDNSMLTMDKKIEDTEQYISRLKDALKMLKKKDFEEVKAKWDKENDKIQSQYEKELAQFEKKEAALEAEAKKKGITVAVLTGTTKRDKPPKKPTKKILPKNEDAIKKAIEKAEEKIKVFNSQKQLKEDNKAVALGTSRINYCDPRITVAWCKRNNVPVNKLFAKTLMDKFPWAMDAEPDYEF